jgi:tRNA nucleotidyltransferase (CCA-adding enzyme)
MYEKIPIYVYDVLEELHQWGHQAYVVGGCVRDTLLGRTPKDWDVCTDAAPERLLTIFPKCIPTGIKHGTVTVVSDGNHVEVTTFRSEEEYTDGRRPDQVKFETDIEKDLSRRDFTVNAMAYSPHTGKLVDPFGGQKDLKERTIRCVGDPLKRFGEDGLRTMRAIRFCSQLGFKMDMNTYLAIEPSIPTFRKVAVERVRDEFEKILVSPHAEHGLYQLDESRLGHEFLPKSGWWTSMPVLSVSSMGSALDVRLCVLLSRENSRNAEEFLLKMKFTSKTVENVVKSVRFMHRHPEEWESLIGNPVEQRFEMSKLGKEHVSRTLDAGAAALVLPKKLRAEMLVQLTFNTPLSIKELALKGGDIPKILDVKPGPEIGFALNTLLDWVLAHPEKNTREELVAFLRDSYAPSMGLPLVQQK